MDVQRLIELGNERRKARDFQGALDAYRQAMEQDPANQALLLAMGDAYRGLKDFENSLRLWMQSLETHPKDVPVLTRVADAHKNLGHRDLAVEFYRRALDLQKNNRYALMGIGDLHYKEGNYREALVHWERLLQVDPRLINIITMVGNIHRRQHNFEKAVDCFSAAIKLSPDNNYAIYGMADALRGLGRYPQAAPYWEEIAQRDPGSVQVLTRAGDCFFRLGDPVKAEQFFRRAMAIRPDAAALRGLSRIQRSRGEFAAALANYACILARTPGDARTLVLVGETLCESAGREAALDYLRGQLKDHPGAGEIEHAIQRLSASS